jgi:hypothetical protein
VRNRNVTHDPVSAGDPGGMSPTVQRSLGVVGIVSIVAGSVPYMFVPSAPGSGASAADIVSFYNEHEGVLLATWSGGALPVILAIVFLSGLVALMRSVVGDADWRWLVLLLGAVGIIGAAMAMAVLGAALPLAAATDEGLAIVLLRLLALSYGTQFLFLVPFLGLIGWITTTRGGFPAWLGYATYAAAVVCAIATFGIFVEPDPDPAGERSTYLAFLVGGLWWILTGIVLIVRPIRSMALTPGSSRAA